MATLVDLYTLHGGGASYSEIARRAGLSVQHVHKMLTGKNTSMPEPESVYGLARGLGVSRTVILHAAAEGIGIELDDDRICPELGEQLPLEVDLLTDEGKAAIIQVAKVLVEAQGLAKPKRRRAASAAPVRRLPRKRNEA